MRVLPCPTPFLMAIALFFPPTVAAQRPFVTSRYSITEEAGKLLNAGRGNEARILLQRSARENASPALRALYRLELGNSYLFDGMYVDARRTYDAVLAGSDAKGVDSLLSWAHRGIGMADALSGREVRGATHLGEALAFPVAPQYALADSIEMLIVTGQHDAAAKALDRLEGSNTTQGTQQYAHAFRAVNSMLAGHCTRALEELAKAPYQDRPVPRAVRGRCASKHGRTAEAAAIRDSVLKQPMPDPFAWTMIIARDAARKIR